MLSAISNMEIEEEKKEEETTEPHIMNFLYETEEYYRTANLTMVIIIIFGVIVFVFGGFGEFNGFRSIIVNIVLGSLGGIFVIVGITRIIIIKKRIKDIKIAFDEVRITKQWMRNEYEEYIEEINKKTKENKNERI